MEVVAADPRSGAVSFLLPGAIERGDVVGEFAAGLLAAATAADDRRYGWVGDSEQPGRSGTAELRSHLAEVDLPVVGPGGRMLLVEAGEVVTGDITIRRRIGARSATAWRLPPRLPARVGAELDLDIALYVEVGFFEASKREVQDLMRPVLLMIVEHEADSQDEFDVGWRHVLVEPVTEMDGVPPGVGIDLWYDPEGDLRG